ncbi:hypothetical protein [Rickettsia hoogstraalii]|uniref:hypothetical protein n=1 Tax=Rickettsia hoogstraalii TaxID=467174 RepID=UPI000B188390|nr:hypothetical protein [Rickettsia hoogstraalii]
MSLRVAVGCVDIAPSLRGNCIAIDEAISGVCYYFMRLPRSLRLLAMTGRYPRNNATQEQYPHPLTIL